MLALGHACCGNPTQSSGYLGSSDMFAQAIADFAETSADQTERKHTALVAVIKEGRVPAESDVSA